MIDERDRERRKKKRRIENAAIWGLAILITVVGIWIILAIMPDDNLEVSMELPENQASTEKAVPSPAIDVQLLDVNEYSRPGEQVDAVEKVVVHYLANPMTTAQQNRDYFESLKDLQDVSMSANFIVGLEGEIIECVPPGEIAYASNSMNHLSVSIENCHPDTTGKFTEATYQSLVELTGYLVDMYGLGREDIIRHYDVTGKECPLYFVEHEDKWEAFKDDVMDYIEKSKE